MFDRFARAVKERLHLRQCRAVLDTPPLVGCDDGVIVFSMIGTRVVLPYLVAVKSFMQALGRGRPMVMDDGTLTAGDRAVLRSHLVGVKIVSLSSVDTGDCPTGGTWERLLYLLDLARDAYVIQLDSDIVTVGSVAEVGAAIEAGRCFTLLGGTDAQALGLQTVAQFRAAVYPDGPGTLADDAHVQLQFETRADQLADANSRYLRACSGCAGFAPGAVRRSTAEAFSRAATSIVGARQWARWGSEQITSNYLIANTDEPVLLPYDRYYNFWNDGDRDDPALIHFVGTHRFTGNAYATATTRALASLV